MQIDNAFYCSAQMLKFKNNFTKPLSLQIVTSKDIYSLHGFIFQKLLGFYPILTLLTLPRLPNPI